MKLSQVDLNLLVALDALLAERNVTRAGERLHLSQPTMSGSLAKLRKMFNDPLLVRAGNELQLTQRAMALREPVREILALIQGTISPEETFDPATSTRTFSVGASDYAALLLIPPLLSDLAAQAPGVAVSVFPRRPNVARLLDTDDVDILIEPRELFPAGIHPSQDLFMDRWLCALWAEHPTVQDALSMDDFTSLPHLVYSLNGSLSVADEYVARQGIARRIEVTIQSFGFAPFLLRGTTLISLVLERAAIRFCDAAGIKLLEPPLELPAIHEAMFWNDRHSADPGHIWFRERIAKVATAL